MPTTAPSAVAETVSDEALLRRFADRREPDVFTALAERHAGLVFGTCLRITADRHDAEELTQDCFLQLARKASTVRSSVAGWLHQVATHRSLNAVRADGRRRAHEARAAAERSSESEPADASWREVEPLLDEAVDALPDGVRDAIILHFLKSLPQGEVADRLGVHQSTVSRRVGEGLKLLHDHLQASGVVFSATPLAVLLAANAAQPEAPNLTASLGKISLLGAGSGAAGKVVAWLGVSLSQLKTWGLLASAAIVPILVQLLVGGWLGFLYSVLVMVYFVWRRPAWIEAISPLGKRVYDSPFFPWKRWTWTTPPVNWRGMLVGSLVAAAMLGIMGWASSQGPTPIPGNTALFAAFALVQLSTAARVGVRVLRFKKGGGEGAPAEKPPTPDLITVVQGAAGVAVGMLMAACWAQFHARVGSDPRLALGMVLPLAISAVWASVDAVRNLRRYLHEAPPPAEEQVQPRSSKQAILLNMFIIIYFTVQVVLESLHLLRASNYAEGVMFHEMSLGVLPSISLFFLIASIRPFARLRATMRPDRWRFGVALAVLCAVLNLGFCIAWLMPRG